MHESIWNRNQNNRISIRVDRRHDPPCHRNRRFLIFRTGPATTAATTERAEDRENSQKRYCTPCHREFADCVLHYSTPQICGLYFLDFSFRLSADNKAFDQDNGRDALNADRGHISSMFHETRPPYFRPPGSFTLKHKRYLVKMSTEKWDLGESMQMDITPDRTRT